MNHFNYCKLRVIFIFMQPTNNEPIVKHLILDCDQTLLDGFTHRPYLAEFLHFAFNHFETVSLWTYADEFVHESKHMMVLSQHLPQNASFYFRKTRKDCVVRPSSGYFDMWDEQLIVAKPLSKIFNEYPHFNANNTLIVDDNRETFQHNVDNAIHIKPFYRSQFADDSELLGLVIVLENILKQSSACEPKCFNLRYVSKQIVPAA